MKMIEWERMPRSIRYDAPEMSCDVWPTIENGRKIYRFTVFDNNKHSFIDNGYEITEDLACERALVGAGI